MVTRYSQLMKYAKSFANNETHETGLYEDRKHEHC